MMSQSWMGTDFTNDDLVKESSVVDDYFHRLVSDTILAGRDCHIIEFLPKPTSAVVWGKLLVSIDKKDFLELYTEFYDEEGALVNLMLASNIKEMDGRLLPTKFEMIPLGKPGQKTEIIYKTLHFNQNMNSDFFTIDNMKRIHDQ